MDAARVPSMIAGADLGPASDLRAETGRRGADRHDEDVGGVGGPGGPGPCGAHHLPPRQGTAVADGHRPRAGRRAHADRLGPDACRDRRGAAAPLRGADPLRGGAVVQLVRALQRRSGPGRDGGAGTKPVAGARSSGPSRSSRRRRPRPRRRRSRPVWPSCGPRLAEGRTGPDPARTVRPVRSGRPIDPRWGWPVACRNSWNSCARRSARHHVVAGRVGPRRLHPRRGAHHGARRPPGRRAARLDRRGVRGAEAGQRARRARSSPAAAARASPAPPSRWPTASCWPSTA